MARADWRCIRLHVELFARDCLVRRRLGATLHELGLIRAARPAAYERTLSLDLSPPVETLFAELAPSARRNVRAPRKRGFRIAVIDDVRYAGRLRELTTGAFRRTGGGPRELPWSAIIRMSVAAPQRSRLIGLFAPAPSEQLLSFAWGCVHGRYATYEAGAADRRPELGNLALGYALVWDLVVWAKSLGMDWFDLGGVSMPPRGAIDPLDGITAFKRYFCNEVVSAGEDWLLEPRPRRARLAGAVSAAAQLLTSYAHR